ncbi:hypothetical protein SAMN05216390_101125 [Lachnospiraceae bacterium KH1T2]|nr:hypothetical protein SAMN05216390_101125 [Lachnospiraceae bacterium KH1T2]
MKLVRVQDSEYKKTYELYMSFPENLRVQIKNGAYIHHENEIEYFTRTNLPEDAAQIEEIK